jgi:2C-methyl-D-erythritol 2,4-cyclodiphosphate synthase
MDGIIFSEEMIINGWINKIRESIVEILWCQKNQISIKQATSKNFIFTTSEDAIAALVTITLKPRKGR